MRTVLWARIFGLLSIALLSATAPSPQAHAQGRPLALVYQGDGACLPCLRGAIRVAFLAGFDVRRVDRKHWADSLLDEATLWIQPGGQSLQAARAMGPELMQKVQQFVAHGGGYVGFCAGGFISTGQIGDHPHTGLGIVPGATTDHIDNGRKDHLIEPIRTLDGERWVYFAGGPQFIVSPKELEAVQGRVTSWSQSGQILSLEARFGAGRVAVAGFHPEASTLWKKARLLFSGRNFRWDHDGNDYDFAVNMIRYATKRD
jgi:glutamine amidotransferase-like uncharacterized protein